MAIDVNKIKWADNLEIDPVSGLPNKEEPPEELKISGTKRAQNLTRQHFNYLANQYYDMMSDLQQQINDLTVSAGVGLLNTIFPVGSYWTNGVSDADPATILGFGTWVRVKGKFVVGVDEVDVTWDAGLKTGGSKNHTHTASTASAGSHNHGASTGAAGGHSHTVPRDGWGTFGDAPAPGVAIQSGRIAVGSGLQETTQDLQSIRASGNDNTTSTVAAHTHSISSDGSHTHTITVNNSNNLPPFEAAFIWRRTA